MTRTVVVAGSVAQRPGNGGHAWVLLQYLLGFKRLGWDVLFLDRISTDEGAVEGERINPLVRVMERFGLDEQFALLCDSTRETIGLSRPRVVDRVRDSTLLLNVMGFLTDEELLGLAPKRVFLDIDPGFPQMWHALGLHDAFSGHDAFVTIGTNIGQPECVIPTCGHTWITTPQPVVLEH